MSSSAISPISGADFGSSSASAPRQGVISNLVGELEQSITSGDLTGSQAYLTDIESIYPSSASRSNALGAFLIGVGTALSDGSVSETQSALATYQAATASSAPSAGSAANSASAASIAENLVLSQIQLNLVSTLLGVAPPGGNSGDPGSSSSSIESLLNILNEAYGAGSTSSTGTSSANNGSSPYDALVSAIQSSLSSGTSPANAALSYLSPTGNYVNTFA